MSKIIRTRKPSVLPYYAAALAFVVLCAVLPVYRLWALMAALGAAVLAFAGAKKICPPRVVEHEVPFHTGSGDVDEMLALLAPLAKRFVTVAAHTPRAMPAETLAGHIRARGCKAEAAPSIEAGVARAVALGGDGPVCALGTLYFSGDVRTAFEDL